MSKTYTTHQNNLYELPFTIDVKLHHHVEGIFTYEGEVIINFDKISSLALPFHMTDFDEIHFNCDNFENEIYCIKPIEKLWLNALELLEDKTSYRELIQQKKEELLNG